LNDHLSKVKRIHENDLNQGYGEVYMPSFIDPEKCAQIIRFSIFENKKPHLSRREWGFIPKKPC